MITDPWFYAAAIPALLIFGVSKGGFGAGLGMLAVPLMAQVVSPVQAAAIALPILCVMDLVGLRSFWRAVPWSLVSLVLVPALGGLVLGMVTFQHMNLAVIEVLLGSIALVFTLWRLALARWAVERPPPGPWSGRVWGCVSGFTSFVAHAGGPPLAIWLLPQRLSKTSAQAINVVFFAVVNYAKLLPYAWLGQFDSQNLATSLVLLPLAPIGVWIGVWCHARVSDVWFYRICYAVLVVAGVKLLYDGSVGPGGLMAG